MSKWLAVFFLVSTFSCIGFIFWYSDWVYNLPTPVPSTYHAVEINEHIDISGKLISQKKGPIFLHFFNPDCPCSKFNINHFNSLVKNYHDKINFAVVAITKNVNYTEAGIQNKFNITVPVLFDTSLAAICGVYSTPQAVLLDSNRALYYRGNYNRNRYCTNNKSNYAKMAIDSLIAKKNNTVFNPLALKAYGCSLPGCKKNS